MLIDELYQLIEVAVLTRRQEDMLTVGSSRLDLCQPFKQSVEGSDLDQLRNRFVQRVLYRLLFRARGMISVQKKYGHMQFRAGQDPQ